MSDVSDLIATDIEQLPRASTRQKSLLRFITCGSVDDGKSTLIGRLLYEAKMLFEDQLAAVEADSQASWGTQGGEIDFALLVDGLAAEREQGITIDVAYRFFSTDKRKFIVADTPGHEQYTRNMVTGASTADLAVILIDARKGVLTQTRRHSCLVSLIGIRKVVLAINKMDLVDYSRGASSARSRRPTASSPREVGLEDITAMPLSALRGDNMLVPSANTPWYDGPTLMGYLESVELDETRQQKDVVPDAGAVGQPPRPRLPRLLRHDLERHRQAGRRDPRPAVRAARAGSTRIVTANGDLPLAVAGQSITLTLADEIDISRGDVISAADAPPRSPTSSSAPSSGWPRSRCCPAAPTC